MRKVAAALAAVATAVMFTIVWLHAEQLDDEREALVADQVEVVKAARNISAGTPLTKDRITTEKVPRKFLPPNPLLESELSIYLGTPVAVDVEEGSMILTSDFSVSELSVAALVDSPLLIKSANMTLESADPIETSGALLTLVSEKGGYVVESDLTVDQDTRSFSMIARIPAVEFEDALAQARKLGRPIQERIRGAGVSDQVRQLEAKLGNKMVAEEQLADGAEGSKKHRSEQTIEIIHGDGRESVTETKTTFTDTEARTKLVEVREEIFDIEGELNGLHNQVALATIRLTVRPVRPEIVEPEPPSFGEELEAAFSGSLDNMKTVACFLVRCVVTLLPFAVFGSPFLLGLAFLVRRRRTALFDGDR